MTDRFVFDPTESERDCQRRFADTFALEISSVTWDEAEHGGYAIFFVHRSSPSFAAARLEMPCEADGELAIGKCLRDDAIAELLRASVIAAKYLAAMPPRGVPAVIFVGCWIFLRHLKTCEYMGSAN